VVDQQSSAVPGAMIRIKDDTKGFTQSTVTDREGRFVFPQLSPGTYTLAIESKGFKRTERTNLELHDDEQSRKNNAAWKFKTRLLNMSENGPRRRSPAPRVLRGWCSLSRCVLCEG
jgi:hypothetical protein